MQWRERTITNQMNITIVSKATLGKPQRDKVVRKDNHRSDEYYNCFKGNEYYHCFKGNTWETSER